MSGKLEGKIAVITGGTSGMGLLDEDKLGFADFSGNRQYITLGNLSENPQAFIFLDAPLIEQLQQRIGELELEAESRKSKSSVTSKLYEENGHAIQ